MTDYLRYDFDNSRCLVIDMPREIYNRALSETRLAEVISHDLKLVTARTDGESARLTLRKSPFKIHNWDTNDIEAAASHWLYAIEATRRVTPTEQIDPILDVQPALRSGHDSSGQQRIPFYAKLAWPIDDPQKAQIIATEAMRSTALRLGYLKESFIDAAYAHVSNEGGMELQSLDIACSCLSTDGMVYTPEVEHIELHGHNLYSRQMVLTCFSGLVAVARQKG